MRYMLVNVSPGSLQVDLHSPDIMHNSHSLHRPGPIVALSIPRGKSVDILPHFGGNMEKAHAAVKYSRDALKFLRPNMLSAYVCDDKGVKIDVDALLGGKVVKEKVAPTPPKKEAPVEEAPVEEAPVEEAPVEEAPVEEAPVEDKDITVPDMGEGAVIAAIDQHEAEITGEANSQPAMEEIVKDSMVALKHVGAALEQKLYDAGLMTYADVVDADEALLEDIIGHKASDVRKQAKKLAKK